MLVTLLPQCIIRQTESGWEAALGYVQDHWRQGDAVATCSPPASQFVLGRTDYYVTQRGEVFDDADIWTGAPLVDTTEGFSSMLTVNDRVWFVIEREWCWKRNLSPQFQETVRGAMHLAYEQCGKMVLVSDTD